MNIWAIADLHLAKSHPDKAMDLFGGNWVGYMDKLETRWKDAIQPDDLVLIPGDICWAMKLKDAIIDLDWIASLPGTKVMIKGNHDLWWSSLAQLRSSLPPSIHVIQNDIFRYRDIEVGGARLWDSPEYSYNAFIEYRENPKATQKEPSTPQEDEKIFIRELHRLETSLKGMKGMKRIAMVHYPPIGPDLAPSRASQLLEQYKVNVCVFGHIHQVREGSLQMGEARGVRYYLTAADYLDFNPLKIEL